MAGYVCTLAGGKGGVGKTTTAVNVATVLEDEGYNVVVVDADLGMANLAEMLALEFENSIHDVLAGTVTLGDSLTATADGVTIVPGEQSLEAFADADPTKLQKVIKTLQDTHDVVLVDTAAGLSNATTIPLGLADSVLLLTTPDDVAVNDTAKTEDLIDRVGGSPLGTLVTYATADTDLDDIESKLDSSVLGAIPADAESTQVEPVVSHAPDTDVADAYKQLTGILQYAFFEEGDPDQVQRVFDETWFETDEDDETEDEGDEDDDDDSEGYTHSVFRGI